MRRVILPCLLAGVLAMAATATGAAPPALPAVTTSASAVSVKVTPRTLSGPTWDVEVVFDTHSQELKDDLLKTAVLVAADGSELAPVAWQGAPPGGHHRSGVLRFQAPDPAPAVLVLRLARPGEPQPRIFQWKLR